MLIVMMEERQSQRVIRLDAAPMYSSRHDLHARQDQGPY